MVDEVHAVCAASDPWSEVELCGILPCKEEATSCLRHLNLCDDGERVTGL